MTRIEELSKQLQAVKDEVSGIKALTIAVNKLVIKHDSHDVKLDSILAKVSRNEENIQAVRSDLNDHKVATNERLSALENEVTVNRDHDERIETLEKELKSLRNESKITKLLSEHHNKKVQFDK